MLQQRKLTEARQKQKLATKAPQASFSRRKAGGEIYEK